MTTPLHPSAATFLRMARRLVDAPWLREAVAFVDARMEQDGGHDYGHLWRVLVNARRIFDAEAPMGRRADGAGVSWDAIAAAVLLHDVVNLPKNHPERHLASQRSAEVAELFLRESAAFPPALIPRVGEAIRVHSYSAGLRAESDEARIMTDADRLESIGAFAVARTFYVSGAMKRSIADLADPFARARPLDDREFGVDHFFAKLLRLRELLYTDAARALAQTRHAFMERFLEALGDELGAAPEPYVLTEADRALAGAAPTVRSERLRLVAATVPTASASAAGALDALGTLLAARLPADWPPPFMADAEAALRDALREDPASAGWWGWFIVEEGAPEGPVAVGTIGFRGAPQEGVVELGYSVMPSHQRRGIASEAARALIEWAFAQGAREVVAETFPSLPESVKVMERAGMSFRGAGAEPGSVRYGVTRRS